jgi:rare lipoprotein A (peptidoglycan hydrolase)
MAKKRKELTFVSAPPTKRRPVALWLAAVALLVSMGLAASAPRVVAALRPAEVAKEGRASWYGADFQGSPTASGEPFDMYGLTAAHRTLPLGSQARVTNLDNGRSVVVRINDRGPFHDGRMVDLSYEAAREIGMVPAGTARVEVTPLGP